MIKEIKIAAVIPSYRVKKHILGVINGIFPIVDYVIVVDDCCPEGSGEYVEANLKDSKVIVIKNDKNLGVGGSVMVGFSHAVHLGATVLLKLDGDGQMDPNIAHLFIEPIRNSVADYTKGNRFTDPDALRSMPLIRLIGNGGLSFLSKASTGYWGLMDPTNGYLAISSNAFNQLPQKKISSRYFFESDILFRLYFTKARVLQVPMMALYGDEKSSLSISKSFFEFGYKNLKNFIKRIIYSYFILDFNLGSISLVFSLGMFLTGLGIGLYYWIPSVWYDQLATSGQVMMAALPIMLSFQSLFFFFSIDVSNSNSRIS
jgi:dolichol-phosphate mannosyltransferase